MSIKSFLITAVLITAILCSGGFVKAESTINADLIAELEAQIKSLLSQIAELQAQQNVFSPESSWCYTFSKNLGFVNSGTDDVLQLHTALQLEGIFSGSDSGNTYAEDTAVAVAQFQKKYSITPASGYVAAKTRAKLNALYGCAVASTQPTTEPTLTTYVTNASGLKITSPLRDDNNTDLNGTNREQFWVEGETHDITWTTTGVTCTNCEKINILVRGSTSPEYYADNTRSGCTIANNVSFASGSYSWAIPSTFLKDCFNVNYDSHKFDAEIEFYSSSSGKSVGKSEDFRITPYSYPYQLIVTSPDNGDTLQKGKTYNIKWHIAPGLRSSSFGISLLGSTNPKIVSKVAGSFVDGYWGGEYSWTVPVISVGDTVPKGENYQICVGDWANGTSALVQGRAIGCSKVKIIAQENEPNLSVVAPVLNEQMQGGATYNIKWNAENMAGEKLNIFLNNYKKNNNSSTYNSYIALDVDASAGSYSWTVPADISGDYKIELNAFSRRLVSESKPFNIVSTSAVHFTLPTNNSKWVIGEKYSMSWTLPEKHEWQVASVYLVDSSSNKTTIVSKYTTGRSSKTGGYSWSVPSSVLPGDYKLYVETTACDSAGYTNSCKSFVAYSGKLTIAAVGTNQPTIKVLTPVTGDTLNTYSTYNITWQQENLEGSKVDIIATSTQGREQPIVTGVDASLGTYAYSILPAMGGGQVWNIKVASNFTTSLAQIKTGVGYTFAYSGQFKVNHGKKIKVEAPNGGQTLNYDTTYNIRWITGNVTTSNIYLVNSVTGAQYTIATNVPSATTDFIYSYPFKPTTIYPKGNYKFLIADSSDATIKDYSDNSFTIGNTVATCTENWSCGSFGACVNGYQTKECIDLNSCGTSVNKPTTTQSCTNACTPSWNCTWGNCVNGWKTATCIDSNNCGTVQPASTQSCTTCTPNWKCDWGECVSGYRSHIIVDANNCGLPSSSSGVVCTTEVSSCTTVGSYITTVAPNGNETLYAGDTYNIRWTSSGLGTVNINLQNYSSGGLYYSVAKNISASAGVYSWRAGYTVDNVLVPSGEKYKILIGYGDKNDYSDNYFTIANRNAPTIRVTSPNGGESWSHGSTHTITWTASNAGNINIFAKNVATGGLATVAANISSTAGNYTWTLPPTSTATAYSLSAGQYKIWIVGTDLVNGVFTEDYSDSSITISNQVIEPPLTVISPNSGETLTQDTTSTISWKTSGINGYGLAVYLKNMDTGTLYAIKTGSTVAAGTSSYSWTVPSTVPAGNRYKVRVYAWDGIGNSAEDYSDSYITVIATSNPAYLRFTAPTSGSSLTIGSTYTITWQSSGINQNYDMMLVTSTGESTGYAIARGVAASAGQRSWFISGVFPGQYKIAFAGSYSDVFTLANSTVKSLTLNAPNGGEVWYKDTQYSITWSSANVSKVNLYLENSWNGTRYTIATGVTASNHLYYWKIPTTYTNDTYKILIADASDSTLKDYSNNTFSIISRAVNPGINLVLPGGGESLKSGDVYNITWDTTALANTSKIRILLFDENVQPSKMYTLATELPYTARNYSWTVGSDLPAGEKYMIRLQVYRTFSSGAEEGFANDYSGEFSINLTPTTPTITVRTPPGNVILFPGDTCTTTWTSKNVSKVTIRLVDSIYYPGYKTDEAQVYFTATDVSASAGTYTFKIPTTIDFGIYSQPKQVKVWISDQGSSTAGSSGFFYLNKTRSSAIENDTNAQLASISDAISKIIAQIAAGLENK